MARAARERIGRYRDKLSEFGGNRIQMRRRTLIVLCVAAIGLVAASTTYVHSGYIGAIANGDSIKLIARGPHFRLPWRHVSFYPTRAGAVNIRISSGSSEGEVKAEVSLNLSVSPDSVASLERAFHGNYVQAIVVPRITAFLVRRGQSSANWDNDKSMDAISRDLAAELNRALASYGIGVAYAELRSFEITQND